MSIPFIGEEFTFTQPDGSALKVRGWGNQYHAVFETLNGFTIVEDPTTKFYQYAALAPDGDELIPTGARPRLVKPSAIGLTPSLRVSRSAAKAKVQENPGLIPGNSRWEQRRKFLKRALLTTTLPGFSPAPPHRETVGDFVGLCLLIQFPDVKGAITKEQVEAFCNKPGYAEFGNNGSVYDYFFDISGGKLRYKNIVAPYYMATHPKSYYTNESIAQPIRTRELIKEALDYHRSQGFDFSGLTSDDQQYVYATNLFYAGPCVNQWSKGLWPHSFHLQTPYQLSPGKNCFDYQITDMSDELTLGTFCHENGHMICDFPDLYDYGGQSAGVGEFCLMCSGGIADKKNPAHVGAYLKYKAGWAQAITKITAEIAGKAVVGSNQFFIHRKGSTEYYILEGRLQEGRDQALPSSGIAIWHIDELGDNQNEQMTAAMHYECSLVQADGRNDLENDRMNQGDVRDLFSQDVNDSFSNETTPSSKWWDGTLSNLEISAIGPIGAEIKFNGRA